VVDDVDEAVRRGVHVGVVDLVRVAREHDLRSLAGAGDDRLHLVGREVLRLVDDQELAGDAPAPDVGQGLDVDDVEVEELPAGPAPLRVLLRDPEQEIEVVLHGLHPGAQLLVDLPGQVADVAPHG